MKNIYALLILSLLFISCEKSEHPACKDWQEGILYFTGEPALDGCGWLLLSEGESYHLSHLNDEFKIPELDVWFKGIYLSGKFNCGFGMASYKVMMINRMMRKPWEARFLSDYPGRNIFKDSFFLDSAYVEGDSLHIHVGYSGGCAIHQFNLWILESGLNGEDQPHLQLEHNGNGDSCEAYLRQWLSFSIKPLRKPGTSEVIFWLRGSPEMSMLFGPYTYKY